MPELIVADDVAAAAVDAFFQVEPRLVSLAGGRTPERFYERLGKASYPWADVELVMGDERCVPPGDPDSNEAMVERALLGAIRPAVFHGLAAGSCDPDRAEERLREVLSGRTLDLAVLGLGADGHTASLFPGDPALDELERLVVRVDRPDHPRLTLTLPVLSGATAALFLVSGEDKASALRRLLRGEDVPAARVRAGRVLVVADHAAAGG